MSASITISLFSLIISLILAVRLFLLDKDYCEFSIIDHGGSNNLLNGTDVFNRKIGYTQTTLRPVIKLLKSDIYNVEITGISKDSILPYKNNKIVQLKSGDFIKFNYIFCNKPEEVKISYRDSKNNLYEQILTIKPFYNGGSWKKSKMWSTSLTNRKWSFIGSFKRKYI